MSPPIVPPPKRRYREREFTKDKPTLDARLFFWLPAIIGGMVGSVWVAWVGLPPFIIPIMAVLAVVVVRLSTGVGAWLMSEVAFGASGKSTPYKGGYSEAESHTAKGQHEHAIEAYEAIVAQSPTDPEPYLRIARIYRKEPGKLDDAAFWYRKARREAEMTPGRDLATSRELIELYLASENPERAIPELARIVEKFQDTPEREWAEGLLVELRREM